MKKECVCFKNGNCLNLKETKFDDNTKLYYCDKTNEGCLKLCHGCDKQKCKYAKYEEVNLTLINK